MDFIWESKLYGQVKPWNRETLVKFWLFRHVSTIFWGFNGSCFHKNNSGKGVFSQSAGQSQIIFIGRSGDGPLGFEWKKPKRGTYGTFWHGREKTLCIFGDDFRCCFFDYEVGKDFLWIVKSLTSCAQGRLCQIGIWLIDSVKYASSQDYWRWQKGSSTCWYLLPCWSTSLTSNIFQTCPNNVKWDSHNMFQSSPYIFHTHRIHVWHICSHWGYIDGKCYHI